MQYVFAEHKMIWILCLLMLLPFSVILLLSNIFIYSSYRGQGVEPISPFRWILSFMIPLLICKWGLHKKHLSPSGAAAAFAVGFIMTLSSYCFMTSMIIFFLAGSIVTKWRSTEKRKLEFNCNDGQRNWVQVVCNGGVAAQLAVIYLIDAGSGEHYVDFQQYFSTSWISMSVLGAVACSSGDTFASEIGSIAGSKSPWLITSFKHVPRGTNGGISVVGTLSSVLGGFVVGLTFFVTQYLSVSDKMVSDAPEQWPIIVTASLAGFIGSIIDSLFGATLQYSGISKRTGCIVEAPGEDVIHISGYPLLNNHGVNLLSSLILCLLTPQFALMIWNHIAKS